MKKNDWVGIINLHMRCIMNVQNILTKSSKPTVLVPWTRQAEKTMVTMEAMRKITP